MKATKEKEKHLSDSRTFEAEVQTLRVHPKAQRALREAHLRYLVDNLDLDAIGVIHAAEYEIDGITVPWIIDGQHRVKALLERELGEWLVEVKVHLSIKDDEAACAMALKLNKRSVWAPFERFHKELHSRNATAIGVFRIAKKYGLTPEKFASDGTITCVNALKHIYSLDGGKSLDTTLKTLTGAWGVTARAVEARLVEGAGRVFGKYNGSAASGVMIKKLTHYPGGAPGLLGDARGLSQYRKSSISSCVAELLIDTYNSGRRSGRLERL